MKKESEKLYMEALIDTLKPSGNVLEIHFGEGYCSARIQTYHPKSHFIIEPDPSIAKKAAQFAHEHPKVSLIQDTWQKALPRLGVFDAIILGWYPLILQEELSIKPSLFAQTLLQKGKDLLLSVEEQFPQLSVLRYSDHDLKEFCEQLEPSQFKNLPRFLYQLQQRGQISLDQYEKTLRTYNLEKNETESVKITVRKQSDLLFDLLLICLEKHMKKGSRFACFLTESNYENPQFFDQIITNPCIDYQEKTISISDHTSLLVMVLEKLN